jgi:DNA replication protein DnaC
MSSLEERAATVQPAVLPEATGIEDISPLMARLEADAQRRAEERAEREKVLAPYREELGRLLLAGRWDLLCPEDGLNCNGYVTVGLDGQEHEELICPAWSDNTCPFWAERRAKWDADDLKELGFQREFLHPQWNRVPADRREALRVYCDTLPARVRSGEGLVIAGQPGSGKTSMLALIATEAVHRMRAAADKGFPGERPSYYPKGDVSYVKSARLFDDLFHDKQDWHRPVAAILLIDDLGTEWRSEGCWVKFNTLIDDRWAERRSTVITTNLGLKQLAEDPAMERMISRLSQRNPWLWTDGADQRQKVSVADWAREKGEEGIP